MLNFYTKLDEERNMFKIYLELGCCRTKAKQFLNAPYYTNSKKERKDLELRCDQTRPKSIV